MLEAHQGGTVEWEANGVEGVEGRDGGGYRAEQEEMSPRGGEAPGHRRLYVSCCEVLAFSLRWGAPGLGGGGLVSRKKA